MKYFLVLVCFLFSCTFSFAQNADLKKINKSSETAKRDQQDIDRLKKIMIRQFIAKANTPKTVLSKQIREFIDGYSSAPLMSDNSIYPSKLEIANLQASLLGYNTGWGLGPLNGDTSRMEGFGNTTLTMIISMPLYQTYRRGYEILSISFICTLSEEIYYVEKPGNELPIEKLPGYKKTIRFTSKLLETDQ